MEKLDRLGWADGIAFTSYRARIGIRTSSSAVLSDLIERLPPRSRIVQGEVVDTLYSLIVAPPVGHSRVKMYHLLYAGTRQIARSLDPSTVLNALESRLRLEVALRAKGRLFVHAGVVAWNGRAILLPGRSHAGKSTLVAALVEAGAKYYSDEYAVLDSRGYVYPYIKPISLRLPGSSESITVPVASLSGPIGTAPVPVGAIVVAKYQQDAKWRPRQITRGQAVMALFDNTVAAIVKPGFALDVLRKAASCCVGVKGNRGEAIEVVDNLLYQRFATWAP